MPKSKMKQGRKTKGPTRAQRTTAEFVLDTIRTEPESASNVRQFAGEVLALLKLPKLRFGRCVLDLVEDLVVCELDSYTSDALHLRTKKRRHGRYRQRVRRRSR